MFIAKEGLKLVGVALVASLVTVQIQPAASVIFLAAGILTALFFRDPHRQPVLSANHILSPADGTITRIESFQSAQGEKRVRVCIFLSIFDVHINRAPVDGQVSQIEYQKGRFAFAFDEQALGQNENNLIFLNTAQGLVRVRQIAGKVARKIVCYCRQGQTLTQGQKIGLIQFGSGVQVELPGHAAIQVQVGQKVIGAITVLGIYNSSQ